MAKRALAHARNLELRAAIGVGTGYQGVGYHPIGFPQRTLLCRQQGQKRRKGMHRERRTLRKKTRSPLLPKSCRPHDANRQGAFHRPISTLRSYSSNSSATSTPAGCIFDTALRRHTTRQLLWHDAVFCTTRQRDKMSLDLPSDPDAGMHVAPRPLSPAEP